MNIAAYNKANTGGTFSGDVTVTGNLIVNGTTTTVNTNTITTNDSLIKLANNNTAGDSVDIGFYGTYNSSGQKYAGLVRQAGSNFFLFKDITTDPSSNTLAPGSLTGANTATLNANITGYITSNGYELYSYLSSAYAQANVTVGVDATQNTRLNSIETINSNQNTTISIIQGIDATQNTRLDGIEGTNVTQNTSITIIQGVDLTQNTNITAANNMAQGAYNQANAANGMAVSAYAQANTASSNTIVIQGVDLTQNTRLNSIETINNSQNTSISIIQGVDNTQNTNITNADAKAQAAFDKANTSAQIADILALSIALG